MTSPENPKASHKVVIDRARWRTGGNSLNGSGIGATSLLNSDGYSCCLGFATQQVLGLLDEQIRSLSMPECIEDIENVDKDNLFIAPINVGNYNVLTANHWAIKAAGINDDALRSHAEREEKLTALFAEQGIELTFTGEYAVTLGCKV